MNIVEVSKVATKYQVSINALAFLTYHVLDIIGGGIDSQWSVTVHKTIRFTAVGNSCIQELSKKQLIGLSRECPPLLDEIPKPSSIIILQKGSLLLKDIVRNDHEYAVVRDMCLSLSADTWYRDTDKIKPVYTSGAVA